MLVKQLIKELQKYPEDCDVMITQDPMTDESALFVITNDSCPDDGEFIIWD